jgi:DNA-binding winged helix-turn-helix (wHTH) protein
MLESKFLACLYERRGEPCSLDELESAVYSGERRPHVVDDEVLPASAEFGDNANLASLAFRIRDKLEPGRKQAGKRQPRTSNYVKYARGRGYWLDNTE